MSNPSDIMGTYNLSLMPKTGQNVFLKYIFKILKLYAWFPNPLCRNQPNGIKNHYLKNIKFSS